MALFVGLPGDYGDEIGEEEGSRGGGGGEKEEEEAALPSRPRSSSRSSPTLTSVVKRLRRAGVPAAIFPYWEFDAAAQRGRLAEAIVEAARGALERKVVK